MRLLVFLLFAWSMAWVPRTAESNIYAITPDGSGDFPTIQAAILVIGDGDVLELTDGTFAGDGNRDLDYLGKAITVRSQGGLPGACIIDCGGSLNDPHRGFYFHSGETAASLLAGVTVRGAFVEPDAGFPACCGAGVLCTDGSSPTISNCIFTANEAGGTGGGMFCDQSSPTVSNCIFSDNRGQIGAGLLCSNGSHPALTACTFSDNVAGGAGGGLACGLSSPTLTGCIFSANSSGKSGGAIWCTESSSPVFSACIFSRNTAGDTWSGGAIHCDNSSSPRLEECTLSNNVAGIGGGLGCTDLASPVVTNCTFSGNSAAFGSGLAAFEPATLTLSNTIIAYGEEGQAIACFGAIALSLTCCDLFSNAGGDWVGCIETQIGVEGNFSEDPFFCNRASGDFDLHQNSPCTADHNPACGLVGARPVSCAATASRPTTWGRIKSEWR